MTLSECSYKPLQLSERCLDGAVVYLHGNRTLIALLGLKNQSQRKIFDFIFPK